jgi:hypothetical protein
LASTASPELQGIAVMTYMVTMAFEGDVAGIDICTVALDISQLEVTTNVVVPGTLDWANEELGRDVLGPLMSSDANIRTTKTQGMGYFPFQVLAHLLNMSLTA